MQSHNFQNNSLDEMIHLASAAALTSPCSLEEALETIPAPIYATDADGWVTFFNKACADFAGRTPVAGQDRWCVTWRLYTEDGAPLPHEECPMAEAIKSQREIRGVVAVAERPDGSRVMFLPHPTPLRDNRGQMIGAINLLIDVTDQRQTESLKAQATRCRRLAKSVTDSRTVSTLLGMAMEYEEKAKALQPPAAVETLETVIIS